MIALNKQYKNYDLHLVIVFMSLAAAIIASIGVSSALFAQVQQMQSSIFTIRPDILGDYMNSPLAVVFNLSLLAAGVCFLLGTLAIYFTFSDVLSGAIAIVGVVVGLSIALMGMFPINFLELHRKVSTLYLVGSLVLHCLCFADYFKPKSTMTRVVFGLSIVAIVTSINLIRLLDWHLLDFPSCDDNGSHFCWVSSSMWLLTKANILWCVCLGLSIRQHIVVQQSLSRHFVSA
jgi:Na+/melibiose symporter-like transporter